MEKHNLWRDILESKYDLWTQLNERHRLRHES